MKIRIKFTKLGMMKFIGHLDMMRYFQKAIRRAGIDIAYSEGYSPHQIMSFASPLGIGITSTGEYFDIEVHTSTSSSEALRALNEAMVEGVQVIEYKQLPEGTKNAMSSVAAADYTVFFKEKEKNPFTLKELEKILQDFSKGQKEISVVKQTKKGEKNIDLKPFLYELKAVGEETPGFFLRLSAGSANNVKPELVLTAFSDYCMEQRNFPFVYRPANMQIHRQEIYARDLNGILLPLGAFGQDIN